MPDKEGSCYRNSQGASAPNQAATGIADFQVFATAADPNSGGQDQLSVLMPNGDLYSTTGDAGVLDLKSAWNTAEFNVFGDGCFSEANFNSGSRLDVSLSVVYGSANAPTCIGNGTTGEENNFTLAQPCCPHGAQDTPGIYFTESYGVAVTSECACPPDSTWNPNASPAQCVCNVPGAVIIGGKCQKAICAPGTIECAGDAPKECNSTGSGWNNLPACTPPAYCKAGVGCYRPPTCPCGGAPPHCLMCQLIPATASGTANAAHPDGG
jgi:hypothetical protein